MQVGFSSEELRNYLCWEDVDRVPNAPDVTAFKRRARLQQAMWREQNGMPIGTHPYSGQGSAVRQIGSRIPLREGKGGANFLTGDIAEAVRRRIDTPQPLQTLNVERLHCDMLSSMPMCFNLFGSLAADNDKATRALKAWIPDCPGKVASVIFEWSPGRGDARYLANRSAFDVAFILDLGDGKKGIVGFETKYHEHCLGVPLKRAAATTRGAEQLKHYLQVAAASGAFVPDALSELTEGPLSQIWLDHLLLLSMLRNDGDWAWGRFCLVYPKANPSFNVASSRYPQLLSRTDTFCSLTLEDMLAAGALDLPVANAFRSRYLWPERG